MSKTFLLAEHATFMLPTNLCIKSSHVSKEEYAVWSIDEIPVGTRFGPYEVKITETKKNESESLYWQMSRLVKEDWDEWALNWFWLVNYTCSKEQQNVIAIRHMSAVYYITSKCIPANTELLVFCAKEDAEKASLRKENPIIRVENTQGNSIYGQWSAEMRNNDPREDRSNRYREVGPQELGRLEKNTKSIEEWYSKHCVSDPVNDGLSIVRRDNFDPVDKQLSNVKYDACIEVSNMTRNHSIVTLYICDICGRSSSHKNNFKRHQLVHTDEKPYKCIGCDKTFKREQDLKDHEKVHSEERKYKCDTCGKAFKQSGGLRVHKTTHSKQRPHECKNCRKAFKTKNNLRRHELFNCGLGPFLHQQSRKIFKGLQH